MQNAIDLAHALGIARPRGAILVLNSGSSSIKFALFAAAPDPARLLHGAISGIGGSPRFSAQDEDGKPLPAALPAGAVLGNKTGNLGFVTHDAGLIKGPDGKPVVLVVLTWGSSEEKGAQLIRDVAVAVYAGLARP